MRVCMPINHYGRVMHHCAWLVALSHNQRSESVRDRRPVAVYGAPLTLGVQSMARPVRLRLGAGLAAGAVIAGVSCAATAASASTAPGPDTLVNVQGALAALGLPGATGLGSTPADTQETVSFVLRERNIGQLESKVTRGMGPFLSVRQFATTYGQTPSVISGLESYLGKFGITASAYGDGIDVVAHGTAGDFNQALSVTHKQSHV